MFVLGFLAGIAVLMLLIWLLLRSSDSTPPPNPKTTITDLERRTVHELLEAELAARAASMNSPTKTMEVTKR